eukprot:CAMPEP_0174818866 /NCGR_PEP_ID=MMETSP1107-20130205/1783_1 /TAXON_ID=36770 /ORGANISM="Paraphysomonas vestita, Strain GFlagA" /LENGTH=80 /DNA_ID=CAMNT_0016031385 /DNA_START=627 /DNA_END=869 /DNA_ORIENTATION=-
MVYEQHDHMIIFVQDFVMNELILNKMDNQLHSLDVIYKHDYFLMKEENIHYKLNNENNLHDDQHDKDHNHYNEIYLFQSK